jgi:hypothetical protein
MGRLVIAGLENDMYDVLEGFFLRSEECPPKKEKEFVANIRRVN